MDISPAFITEYEALFTNVFQTQGSMLRPFVRLKNNVVGSAVRFPIYDVAQSVTNRPVGQTLVPQQNQQNENVTATLNRHEGWGAIDHLQEFMTNVDERMALTESIVMKLGRDLDAEILSAMVASNSAFNSGTSVAMNMALMAEAKGQTFANKWAPGRKTWVITPAVFTALQQIDQFGNSLYNAYKPLSGDGEQSNDQSIYFNGINFIVLPELESSAYWNSTNDHNTYLFHEKAIGLGIGSDIKPVIERRPDLNAMQVLADFSAGAVTILAPGVIKIGVNGLNGD